MDYYNKKINFKKTIDFNYISKSIDVDNHISQFASIWYNQKILQSIIQIRSVETNVNFKKIYNTLIKKLSLKNKKTDLDIFMSWVSGTRGSTHKDEYDVYILGCFGETIYKIENEDYYIEKGDIIYIPKNTTHTAIGLSPRIILSLAVYD